MAPTTSIPTAYPPRFLFQRIKMALHFCGFCARRSSHALEFASVDQPAGDVVARTTYRLCTQHANQIVDTALPVAERVRITATMPVTFDTNR